MGIMRMGVDKPVIFNYLFSYMNDSDWPKYLGDICSKLEQFSCSTLA